MIVYSLLAAEGSWTLFVTTDEGENFGGQMRTSRLATEPLREDAFRRLMQALATKPGDVYVSNVSGGERAKLRHPLLGAGALLAQPPEGVGTFLKLREMLKRI